MPSRGEFTSIGNLQIFKKTTINRIIKTKTTKITIKRQNIIQMIWLKIGDMWLIVLD